MKQFASECIPQGLSTYNLMSKTRTPLGSRCKPPPHFTVKQSVMLSSSSIFPQLEISSWEGRATWCWLLHAQCLGFSVSPTGLGISRPAVCLRWKILDLQHRAFRWNSSFLCHMFPSTELSKIHGLTLCKQRYKHF